VVESFASGTRQIVQTLANDQVRSGHEVHVWHGVNAYTPDIAMDGFDSKVLAWAIPRWGSRRLTDLLFRVGRLTVYTPHGSAFLQTQRPKWWLGVIKVVESIAYRICPTITVACSDSEMAQIKFHLPKTPLLVIPNGCDEIEPHTTAVADLPAAGKLKAVAIGRISVQKNFEELSVLCPLYEQGLSLTVVGGGEPEQEARLESLGLSITGWLGSAQVKKLLREADLLLVSSLWEGMPLVAIDAMSLGVPIVARKAPGVVDLVEHDSTGFLYSSTEELYSSVQKILRSPELLLRLGRCARQKYLKSHRSESMCRAYDDLYRTDTL